MTEQSADVRSTASQSGGAFVGHTVTRAFTLGVLNLCPGQISLASQLIVRAPGSTTRFTSPTAFLRHSAPIGTSFVRTSNVTMPGASERV